MSGIVGNNTNRGSGIVKSAAVGADSIDGSNIADDAIDSEHYTDGSIDNAHIADDAIDSEHYTDGSIDNAHIADDAIDSEHYADGSIDNAHIADDAIDSEHYAAGSIDEAHIADNAVTLAKMAGGTDGNIISYDASGDPVAIATGNDGQVLTSAGAGAPPVFEDSGGGGGKVLQVKSLHYTIIATHSLSTQTFTDIGISLAITPSSSSSKILVQGNLSIGYDGYAGMRILRDSTAIGSSTSTPGTRAACHVGNQHAGGSSGYHNEQFTVHWIDAPATTSAITYKYQFRCGGFAGTRNVYVNREYIDSDAANRTYAVTTLTLTELEDATIS